MNVGIIPVVFLSRFFLLFFLGLRGMTGPRSVSRFPAAVSSLTDTTAVLLIALFFFLRRRNRGRFKKKMESSLFCVADACKDTELLILLQLPFWLFNSPLVSASGEENFFSSSWQHPLCHPCYTVRHSQTNNGTSGRSVPRKLWQLFQWWRLGLLKCDAIAV